MIAFDADILSDLFRGVPECVQRAEAIPADEQALPVVVVEEILRGRLNEIRRAEAGKSRISMERAYELFQETVEHLWQFHVLSYAPTPNSCIKVGEDRRSALVPTTCASLPSAWRTRRR